MFEGDYKNDKKDGRGVFTWASGNIYKGEYIEDERCGNGQMLWTDGSMYEGEWDCGIQHGLGRMIFPDGTTKEGYFENNVFKYEIKADGMVPGASNAQSSSSIAKGSPPGAH